MNLHSRVNVLEVENRQLQDRSLKLSNQVGSLERALRNVQSYYSLEVTPFRSASLTGTFHPNFSGFICSFVHLFSRSSSISNISLCRFTQKCFKCSTECQESDPLWKSQWWLPTYICAKVRGFLWREIVLLKLFDWYFPFFGILTMLLLEQKNIALIILIRIPNINCLLHHTLIC